MTWVELHIREKYGKTRGDELLSDIDRTWVTGRFTSSFSTLTLTALALPLCHLLLDCDASVKAGDSSSGPETIPRH